MFGKQNIINIKYRRCWRRRRQVIAGTVEPIRRYT
jgi:hypothetical protein